jgi:hypothetical protein
MLAADWVTISSLATAGGTLVLAIATFASVRSANRSARTAEVALQEQRRPILVHSRLDDPLQKIGFADDHWVRVEGGHAIVDHDNGNLYLALSLRNVGSGIAVLQGWYVWPDMQLARVEHVPPENFHMLTRDLLIPPGDVGLWQGALRDPEDEAHRHVAAAHAERRGFVIDLLYNDGVGGQRSISRFALAPVADDQWLDSVVRHWNLDGPSLR